MKKLYYTWKEFEQDIDVLARRIKKWKRKFNGIYGMPRGGLPLAVALSHKLNLPLLLGGVTAKTLVVDDIADSGSTLTPYQERHACIVTIFYHPKSRVEPALWLRKKTADWIVFPWEV